MVALILLTVILGVGIYESVYFSDTIDKLSTDCDTLQKLLTDENKADSIDCLNQMAEYWETRNTFIEIVSYTPNIKNVSLDIQETLGAVVADDYKSAIARLYVLSKRLKELQETMGLSTISII